MHLIPEHFSCTLLSYRFVKGLSQNESYTESTNLALRHFQKCGVFLTGQMIVGPAYVAWAYTPLQHYPQNLGTQHLATQNLATFARHA